MKEENMISQKLNNMNKPTAVIIAILLVAACIADAYYAHQAEIKAMQDEGVAKLTAAVDMELYREAEQAEINKILEDTEASIRESKDQAEIDAMIEKALAETSGFKTDAVFTIEEDGIAKLRAAVDPELYREAERKEIEKILESAEAAIHESADQAEIDALVEDAVSRSAEFKTDAEYAQEEAAQQAARKSKKKQSSSNGCIGSGSDVFN